MAMKAQMNLQRQGERKRKQMSHGGDIVRFISTNIFLEDKKVSQGFFDLHIIEKWHQYQPACSIASLDNPTFKKRICLDIKSM